MLNLYKLFNDHLTATTALPLSTFEKNVKHDDGTTEPNPDRVTLEKWADACEVLSRVAYNHAVNGTATADSVFDAWRACLAFFPETLIAKRVRPTADDLPTLCSLATAYKTRSKDARADGGRAKTWNDTNPATFRKGVEDLVVDRINNTAFATPEELEAAREAKKAEARARREERIAEVMEREKCSRDRAVKIIKMLNAEAKAAAAKKEAAAAKKAADAAAKAEATTAAKPAKKNAKKNTKKAA